MESSNLHHHHHQLQDQFLASSSSPLPNPSFYVPATTHAWTPTTINLNGGYFNPRQQNEILVPSLDTSMTQDLGFHWAINRGNFTNLPAHDLHLLRVKEELPDSYTKFTEMMNRASGGGMDDFELNPTSYMKNDQKNLNDHNLSEKLLLRNFSSGCEINGLQPSAEDQYYSNAKIFPTVNISNLSQPMDMNLQALDLFASSRFCSDLSRPDQKHVSLFKESVSYGTHEDIMQQQSHRSPSFPTKTSTTLLTNGVTESKRPSSLLEPKAPQATAAKKSRLDSRASCPPFKIRKEKLGDRIAALQQMVAPFGKTDTASVLMEAIGYIKFLQNQVETLSVPYMKSSGNKSTRTMNGGSMEDGSEELRRDLRSRGLCLVPVSCLSYVAEGGGVWPLPNFGPGT